MSVARGAMSLCLEQFLVPWAARKNEETKPADSESGKAEPKAGSG